MNSKMCPHFYTVTSWGPQIFFLDSENDLKEKMFHMLWGVRPSSANLSFSKSVAFSMCLEEIAPLSHCTLTQMRSVNNIKYKSSLLDWYTKVFNEELPPAFMPCREILLQWIKWFGPKWCRCNIILQQQWVCVTNSEAQNVLWIKVYLFYMA